MGLERIPVVTESADAGLTGNAIALLRQIAASLEDLSQSGETAAIDLGAMPLSPGDKAWLAQHLGEGEVRIECDLDGPSSIRETAYPGVWWLIHRDPRGVITGEFIEITRIPDLVPAHPDDIISGSERLNFMMDDLL
jgi:hydrogenase-1 operon protein HyaF